MSKLYWALVALLFALIVHLSYVLFIPRFEMRGKLDEIRSLAGSGRLRVLERDEGVRLMGAEARWFVHALCLYDLSRGPVMVTAVIPSTYWSMSMYSSRGDNFYSLNDRQAGIERVSVLLKPRRSELIDILEESEVPQGDVIGVEAPASIGIVVMRALAAQPAEFRRVASVLGQSNCRTIGG
jgi:uncharacterized membrane protein